MSAKGTLHAMEWKWNFSCSLQQMCKPLVALPPQMPAKLSYRKLVVTNVHGATILLKCAEWKRACRGRQGCKTAIHGLSACSWSLYGMVQHGNSSKSLKLDSEAEANTTLAAMSIALMGKVYIIETLVLLVAFGGAYIKSLGNCGSLQSRSQ